MFNCIWICDGVESGWLVGEWIIFYAGTGDRETPLKPNATKRQLIELKWSEMKWRNKKKIK